MGAWGTGTFENDDAADVVGEITESDNGWSIIRGLLSVIVEAPPDDSVEAPASGGALAAAEFVAIARGKPPSAPEEDVVLWCEENLLKDPSKLSALAAKAVRRIRASSELKDLWEESEDQGWDGVLADLEKRLTS